VSEGHTVFIKQVTGSTFPAWNDEPVTKSQSIASSVRPGAAAMAQRLQADVFRQAVLLAMLVAALAVASPLRAQAMKAEHVQAGVPQAVGAVHTVRTIPEACARLEGVFTGDAAQAYRMQAVQSAPSCQPRARYVDAAQAGPSQAAGWILNTETRIPQAGCPGREVVVKVWRKPVAQDLVRDGQGQVRIYLQDAQKQAAAGKVRPLPEYSAQVEVEAGRCG
jgi:hypothetical protein